jgi:hypothetical protein
MNTPELLRQYEEKQDLLKKLKMAGEATLYSNLKNNKLNMKVYMAE